MTASVRDCFVELRGLRFHYREWGEPSRRTILLLHGLGATCRIWDLTAPSLAQHFRVVCLDQRGHGETDQPDVGYDYGTVAADLKAFLAATGDGRPALLVGHSWGAGVVLRCGVEYPAEAAGLVLVDGGIQSLGERWSWQETLDRLTPPNIDGLLLSELGKRLDGRVRSDDPRIEAFRRSLFHVGVDGRIRRRFRIPNHLQVLRAVWEERPAGLLARVRCPVLVLPARLPSEPPEAAARKAEQVARAAALQPLVRVRWFEDTIHDVPLQRPDELAGEIAALAAETLSESASGRVAGRVE